MRPLPWWLVALMSSIVAMGVVTLALLCPSPWGWIIPSVGIVVFVVVLIRNPLYFYRRVAATIAGAWLSLFAVSGIVAGVKISGDTFGFFVLEQVGTTFHIVVGVILVVLLVLDYSTTKHAITRFSNEVANANRAEPEGDAGRKMARLDSLSKEWRGKVAYQAVQAYSRYVAIDPTHLTKKDQAALARRQILSQERRLLIGAGIVVVVLGVAGILLHALSEPSADRPVTLFFNLENGRAFRGQAQATIRYGTRQETTAIDHGKVQLAVPGHIEHITSVELDGSLRVREAGPYEIEAGKSITLTIVGPVDNANGGPEEKPERIDIGLVELLCELEAADNLYDLWQKRYVDKEVSWTVVLVSTSPLDKPFEADQTFYVVRPLLSDFEARLRPLRENADYERDYFSMLYPNSENDWIKLSPGPNALVFTGVLADIEESPLRQIDRQAGGLRITVRHARYQGRPGAIIPDN